MLIQCPRFRYLSPRRINCDGGTVQLKSDPQRDAHYEAVCCGSWPRCEIYRRARKAGTPGRKGGKP